MEKHLIWDFGAQFAREPVMRRMPGGAIVVTFLTGGPTEPHNDNVVQLTRSEDDGLTWSEPRTVVRHSHRAAWCTELFTEGPRPFLVIMTYNAQCHYRELQTFRSFSDDGGKTWTEPASFPSGLNGVTLRQGIVMSSGEWLFPLYWQETVEEFDWKDDAPLSSRPFTGMWPFRCGVALSGDGGKTFSRFGYLTNRRGLWEPNCAETEPGHVVMLMRDDERPFLARSDSFDFGRSWTPAAPTDIPNPNTKLTLLRVRGRTLLINNFSPEMGRRTNLEIRVSEDGLASFARALPLEPAGERWFYPHAFADEERETLYVAYENAREHRLAKVPYAELGL